jgi:hypothetical protein
MKKAAPRGGRQRVRFGLVAVVALLGTLILGSSAMSANPRTYSADFSPSGVSGGENGETINLRITNLGTQDLGSADITPPAGIVFTAVSGLGSSLDTAGIHLRNLNLVGGSFLDYAITANISCPARTVNWGNPLRITAHRDNDGGGQAFNLDTAQSDLLTAVQQACTLNITVQPNYAEAGQTITNTAYDPTGSKVTVVALNNDGLAPLAPSNDNVTLGKTAGFFTGPAGSDFMNNTAPLSNTGVAVFNTLKSNRTGFAFKLTATALGYDSTNPEATSRAFNIEVDGTTCPGASCHVETPRGHTTNKVDGAGTTGIDTLGVGLIDFEAPDGFRIPDDVCSTGPFVPLPDSSGFTTSMQLGATTGTSQPDWTVAATLDKFIMNQIPLNGGAHILGCLGANRISSATGLPIPCSDDPLGGFPATNSPDPLHPFTAVCESTTQAWWGLPPNAGPGINTCDDSRLTDPVVLSRNRSGSRPGDFTITLCKPYPWDGGGGWR